MCREVSVGSMYARDAVVLPRTNGTLDGDLAMIMGCYNLMLEASYLDHTNNVVGDLIVETVDDRG